MAILLIDDDEEYLLYLTNVLGEEGHKPLTASTGLAARNLIREADLSLILVDLRLPDDSGLDLLEFARARNPLTVCIAMTALVSEESALQSLRRGAYDYLLKPSGIDVVKAAVRRGLEYNNLRKDLLERTAQLEKLKSGHEQAGALMSHFSHQLRNPLSVVFGCATILTEPQAANLSPEEVRGKLDMIRRNAEQMRGILDDVSRPTAEPPKI